MADRGLEDALTTAIAAEMKDGKPVSLYEAQEGSVPLLHLVRQLLGNATGRQLSELKKLSESGREEDRKSETGNHAPDNEDSSSIELLTLFQRLLLSIIYSYIPSTAEAGLEARRGEREGGRGREGGREEGTKRGRERKRVREGEGGRKRQRQKKGGRERRGGRRKRKGRTSLLFFQNTTHVCREHSWSSASM